MLIRGSLSKGLERDGNTSTKETLRGIINSKDRDKDSS